MMAFDNNMTTALRRPCRFLQGDMLIEHENATCGPISFVGFLRSGGATYVTDIFLLRAKPNKLAASAAELNPALKPLTWWQKVLSFCQ